MKGRSIKEPQIQGGYQIRKNGKKSLRLDLPGRSVEVCAALEPVGSEGELIWWRPEWKLGAGLDTASGARLVLPLATAKLQSKFPTNMTSRYISSEVEV